MEGSRRKIIEERRRDIIEGKTREKRMRKR